MERIVREELAVQSLFWVTRRELKRIEKKRVREEKRYHGFDKDRCSVELSVEAKQSSVEERRDEQCRAPGLYHHGHVFHHTHTWVETRELNRSFSVSDVVDVERERGIVIEQRDAVVEFSVGNVDVWSSA